MHTMKVMIVHPIQAFLFSRENCFTVYLSDDVNITYQDGSTRVGLLSRVKSSLYGLQSTEPCGVMSSQSDKSLLIAVCANSVPVAIALSEKSAFLFLEKNSVSKIDFC